MSSTISTLRALLVLDNKDYLDGLTNTETVTDNFGSKLSNIGGAVVVGGLAVAAAAITTVGVAAWDAGNKVDDAMDHIAQATGATGKNLSLLKTDFKDVFSSVPTDAGTAADAIAILNSKLDITGPTLQHLAIPLLEVTRMTGGDLTANAQAFTAMITAWAIPTDQAAGSLDKLFVVAQKSGTPIATLLADMSSTGPVMHAFGIDFDTGAALMANWEAKGVDATKMLAGLKIAAGVFAKQNIPMEQGLWDTVKAIQGATDETSAMDIAMKVFGKKGAVDMVDAIRSGKFNINDLTSAMQTADGQILKTANSTMEWGEKWKIFQNKMTVALAPLGEKMMQGVGTAMDKLAEWFNRPDVQGNILMLSNKIIEFADWVEQKIPIVVGKFQEFSDWLSNHKEIIVGVLAALGVAALVWGVTTAAAAWAVLVPLLPIIGVILLIAAVAALLYLAWINDWGGIQEKTKAVWDFLQPILQKIWDWLATNIPIAIKALADFWTNTLLPALQTAWTWIQTYLFPLFKSLANLIGNEMTASFKGLAGLWQDILYPTLNAMWQFFNTYFLPQLKVVAEIVGDGLKVAFMALTGVIMLVTDAVNLLNSAFNNMSIPADLKPGSPTPFELGLRGIGDAMQALSRTQLPTFQAALQLNPEPVLASAQLAITPRAMPVSTETPGAHNQQASNEILLKDVQKMLRELPDTIVKATRNAGLKTST